MEGVPYVEKHMRTTTKPHELSAGTSRLSFKSIATKSIARELQFRFGSWNCFDITSKGKMELKGFCDFFSSRQFMVSHSLNIRFSSSSFKRFNCLFRRCSFAFASRTSFRTRTRSLCTLRMVEEGMTKSQGFPDATHARHFSDASPSKHCLPAEEQDLQGRMLMNRNPKFERRNCFRWEDVRLLLFAGGIFHTFGTKVWRGDPMLRIKRIRPILGELDSIVTRILLEVLGGRARMSRD